MAAHKANWFLALFSCVLIITVASGEDKSDGDASRKLIVQLQDDSLVGKDVAKILKEYKEPTVKVLDYNVGELVGWCEEALDDNGRFEIFEKGGDYEINGIPKLKEYAQYCARESILKTISPEDQELLCSFLDHLGDKNGGESTYLRDAYDKLTKPFRDGQGEFAEEIDLLTRLELATHKFFFMGTFSPPQQAKASSPKIVSSLDKTLSFEDILTTKWQTLCNIAQSLYDLAWQMRDEIEVQS